MPNYMPVYEGSERVGITPKGQPGTTIGGSFIPREDENIMSRLARPQHLAHAASVGRSVAPGVTPEAALQEQFRTGQQQIQSKYALQWEEANRSARFIGPAKHKELLRKIDMTAKQEMMAFNQRAQAALAPLQRLDEMAEQGLIPNVDKIKAGMVFGRDVAESMYPTPTERPSIEKMYGTLDMHANRIENRLGLYREAIVPRKRTSLFEQAKRIPLLAPYQAVKDLIEIIRKDKHRVEIMDYSLVPKDPEQKTMGEWRPATDVEIEDYLLHAAEKQEIDRMRKEILGQRDVTKRTVQPGTTGGSFADKVAESIKPSAVELRKQGTRQAYEKGKELGYWQ